MNFLFSIRSIILASGKNRKLRYDLDKYNDEAFLSFFELRFRIIPWSLRNSSKPWSRCMCTGAQKQHQSGW
jgi:hypothetical protein